MHEVLVNRLGGLSLLRKSVVRLTDCPDMTIDVYRGRKTTTQQQCIIICQFLKWQYVERLKSVFRFINCTFYKENEQIYHIAKFHSHKCLLILHLNEPLLL